VTALLVRKVHAVEMVVTVVVIAAETVEVLAAVTVAEVMEVVTEAASAAVIAEGTNRSSTLHRKNLKTSSGFFFIPQPYPCRVRI
jgi:hypothetical protein